MKVFSVRFEELSILLFVAVIILGVSHIARKKEAITAMMPVMQKTIVIDAGHGGFDPGKTGSQGENEKVINLQIAKKLQMYLEQGGATVYMTRNEDEALGDKKQSDMKERKAIANDSGADMLISIHQNAFPKQSAKGAQVFYHKQSAEGKLLAQSIQQALQDCDQENNREAKANTDYYILRTTTVPAAIVECGFLSNPTEEEKLNTEEYQEKIAWAIYVGILNYLEAELPETALAD